jgi:hypothetical protein
MFVETQASNGNKNTQAGVLNFSQSGFVSPEVAAALRRGAFKLKLAEMQTPACAGVCH